MGFYHGLKRVRPNWEKTGKNDRFYNALVVEIK